jgi:hypothetical protein
MAQTLEKWIPAEILEKYECFNYNHAAEILSQSFPEEWDALKSFQITEADITTAGGNESSIPPKLASSLDPKGWKEIRISGDLIIKFYQRKGRKGVFEEESDETKTISNYIDGHNIDFVKNRVAVDFEWNSKDQTFDRDLFAMRTYYECDIISAGVIITRAESLNQIFDELGVKAKYGASTTWMGKLLPRLNSRRHGGCPILAIGITPACIQQ